MNPEKAQELYGALALLQSFMPFLQKLAPEHAGNASSALGLMHDAVRLLERHQNIDVAREALAKIIAEGWQHRLDEKFGGE